MYYSASTDNFDSGANGGADNSWTQADFNLLRFGYDGQSLEQWTEKWFTWAWNETPATKNPLLDTTGAWAGVDNNGPVFFIAGTTGALTSADRTFDVPEGKPLLIPMLNSIDTLDPKPTEAGDMVDFRDSVTSLFATIDGVSITNPESDLVNTGFFPMGGLTKPDSLIASIGAPAYSNLYPTLGSGYWLMVSGLSPGEHTLTFGGTDGPSPFVPSGFSVSVTDHINVVRG